MFLLFYPIFSFTPTDNSPILTVIPHTNTITAKLGTVSITDSFFLFPIHIQTDRDIILSAIETGGIISALFDTLSGVMVKPLHRAILETNIIELGDLVNDLITRIGFEKVPSLEYNQETFLSDWMIRVETAFAQTTTISDQNTTLREYRDKRSLFDLGGKTLALLIGTATQEDFQLLNQRIDNLTSSTENSLYTLEQKAQQLEDTLSKTMRNTKRIYRLLNRNSRFAHMTDTFLAVNDYIRNVANLVRYLITLMIEVDDTLSCFSALKIPPTFTLEQIMRFIVEGEKRFTNRIFPLNYHSTDKHDIFQTLQVFPTNSSHTFLIAIPFASRTSVALYKFITLPTVYPNLTIQTLKYNNFVLLSDNQYITLTDIDSCVFLGHARTYLCEIIQNWLQLSYHTCPLQLFLGLKPTQCVFQNTSLPMGYHATLFFGHWFLVTEEPLFATIACSEMDTKMTTLQPGMFQLQPECSLLTQKFKLSPTKVLHSLSELTVKHTRFPIAKLATASFDKDQLVITGLHAVTHDIEEFQAFRNTTFTDITALHSHTEQTRHTCIPLA